MDIHVLPTNAHTNHVFVQSFSPGMAYQELLMGVATVANKKALL